MIINISKINLSGCSGGGGGDSKVISTKDFAITANGTTNITMDEGVDGISAGTITTNVQPTLTSATLTANTTYTPTGADGFSAVTVNVQPVLTAATFDQNGTYTPGSGVDGFNSVTVNVDGAENRLNQFFKNQVTALTQSDLDGVTHIRDYGLYGTTNLKSVDFPATVKTLYTHALHSSGVESIDVSNVVTIGGNCFEKCYGLTSIDVSSATTIGNACFLDCTGLTTVTGLNYGGEFPSSLFENCTSLSGDVTFNMYSSRFGSSKVFRNCSALRSITYLKNQEEIGAGNATNNQFFGCTSIEYLDLTHNLMVPNLRWTNPFTAFTQNYEIRVPQSLYSIWTASTNWSNAAIVGHIVGYPDIYPTSIVKYTTSDGVELNPVHAYTETSWWNGTYLGKEFDATTGATVTFYGPIKVSAYAYSASTTIQTAEFTNALEIGDGAFDSCSALTSVSLPNTLTTIKQKAFYNCKSLSSITIPDLVTDNNLHYTAFNGCTGLTEVVFGDGITRITGTTFSCGALSLLNASTGITSVTFGRNFSLVSENPFGASQQVTRLTFKSTTPPTISGPFWVAMTGTLYCPAEAVSEYTAWAATVPSLSSGWTITAIGS